MIKNLFTDYQRNLLVYNAWIELLEDMTEVNRSNIAQMTDILSFYEMSDEFLYKYLSYYGLDIEQELDSENEINRNAISQFRYLIQNRGTKQSIEAVFKANGHLYSYETVNVEVFYDGIPLYLDDNYRYIPGGFIETNNLNENNNQTNIEQVSNNYYDATITVILENADIDETSKLLQSIKPAGTKFNIVSQTGCAWAYDYGVYSIEEEFRGKYEKEPKYRQSCFLNVENEEGSEIIDRKPYHSADETDESVFSERDDKWYGISENDKRKIEWTAYDDSNINLYFFPSNKPSPRPFIKGLDSTTNVLPIGWDDTEYTTQNPTDRILQASYPTPNGGTANSISIWDDEDIADIDICNEVIKKETTLPIKMGNVRDFYSQGSNIYYSENDNIINDISVILNNVNDRFDNTYKIQYPTVIYNCNSNFIFNNIGRYDSGENNKIQYTHKSRNYSIDNWKSYLYGSYKAIDNIYKVHIIVPQNGYIIVKDYENNEEIKYNEGEEVELRIGKGSFFSKEFGYFKDDLKTDTDNEEWNNFAEQEQTVSTIATDDGESFKGFCRVEDFVSSSWVGNFREYEQQYYHYVEPELQITSENSVMTFFETGETALTLNFDNTLVANNNIQMRELVKKMSFGTVKGYYFYIRNTENNLNDFFGSYTGFYKVDPQNNRVILSTSIYVPSWLYSEQVV